MKTNKLKVIIGSLAVLLVFISAGSVFKYALATVLETAVGWAWGGTDSTDGAYHGIGWISFNSTDCDADNNGVIDVAECGTIGDPIAGYGVNIPAANGSLSGNAWSEHYGWISFNGADLAGCSPVLSPAARVGDTITGGARIIAIKDEKAIGNAGGYDGCISLFGLLSDGVAPYGITITGTNLSGYAWSSDLGWIDFTGVSINSVAPVVKLTATPDIILSGTPSILTWTITETADSCVASSNPPDSNWSGNKDPNGNNQDVTPIVTSTYSLECWNDGVSSGSKDVVVTVPTVSLTVSSCNIPVGGNDCNATAYWKFVDGTAPYSVEKITPASQTINGADINNPNSNSPVTLKYGPNQVHAKDSGILDFTRDINMECSGGAIWSAINTCELPPNISVDASPKIIRSGEISHINVTVDTPYTVTCSFLNADTPTPKIDNKPSGTYIKDTKPLTSAKIVTVSCTDDTTLLTTTKDVRIDVVPRVQEI